MALFGRESTADQQRAERIGQWVRQRNGHSLAATMFGIIAVVDAWTMVLGLAAGIAAIVLGTTGLRELRDRPEQRGRRLCKTAIGMGTTGIALSTALWFWLR